MGLFSRLGLKEQPEIDWDLTPDDTFGIFESWGGRERVRSQRERFYYFYIDDWQESPRLLFMERGIKHARILARIEAPREMLERCIAAHGRGKLEKSYPIDQQLRHWLVAHAIETDDDSRILPEPEPAAIPGPAAGTGLPGRSEAPPFTPRPVRHEPAVLSEEELPQLIRTGGFFDRRYHPEGRFVHCLVDNGDGLTVSELASGVMWQRGGTDLMAIRHLHGEIEALNRQNFAGFADWRLPTLEEALALLEPASAASGLYLHPCFAAAQPFIFLADERRPGGYWFLDYRQGTVFWASGTIPGGFGRLCRTL